jgi:hypothetical protein
MNVYNHANKIFNLRKGLPIGAVTWGAGSIGSAAISTLAKDLRRRFSGDEAAHPDWRIEPNNYTIQWVAERLVCVGAVAREGNWKLAPRHRPVRTLCCSH